MEQDNRRSYLLPGDQSTYRAWFSLTLDFDIPVLLSPLITIFHPNGLFPHKNVYILKFDQYCQQVMII